MPPSIPIPESAAISAADLPPPPEAPRRRRGLSFVPPAAWRALRWLLAGVYFIFAATLLTLRYGVLPHIDDYRDDLERALTKSLGLKVAIRALDADWQGLNPRLALHGLEVRDAAGRTALAFENVDAVVSWTSLPLLSLRLHRLKVQAPTLALRRETDGTLYVAGLAMTGEQQEGGFSEWLLRQRAVIVADATVQWTDAQRGAPPLELRHVNLRLENFGAHHRFSLTAQPPPDMAAAVDVRGDLRGRDLARLEDWEGETYLRLDYADLAVWRQWIDYPAQLPQGRGALRLWVDLNRGHVDSATADVALENVQLRLKPGLPLLDLVSLQGRLRGGRPEGRVEMGAQKLTLATRDGLRMTPTDFSLRWREGTADGATPAQGEFSGNVLDLDALRRLAAYLPLEEPVRARLDKAAPRGRAHEVRFDWHGPLEAPQRYELSARLDGFGMEAQGPLPGAHGLSGFVEADQDSGKLTLASRNAALLLPQVFPEPKLALDQLDAQASWTLSRGAVDVQVQSASFSNVDAAGSVFGHYRSRADSPGEVDLSARLTRTNMTSIWRYLPHVVLPEVRDWLRHAVYLGRSDDARLSLKGDLARFPYADGKSGTFRVSGRFGGATLRFAPGWPELKEVAGDLLFEGSRMLITARQGRVRGVAIHGVSAEIPELGADAPMLHVHGQANGPTADFLRYVAESPVAEWTDQFTAGMGASGGGNLDLALTLPLSRLEASRVQGEFVIANNRVTPGGGLPPLEGASARINFSEKGVTLRNGSAMLLGSPVSISAQTKDGAVSLNLDGSASAAGLRQVFETPLLAHLSGSTRWRGSLRLQRGRADVTVESNLLGVASSLPEPFNKSAAETLALRLDRTTQPELAMMGRGAAGASREVLKLHLGEVMQAALWRRLEGNNASVERGVVGLGEAPLAAPERGVLLAGRMKQLDADRWRALLGGEGEGGAAALPVTALDLRAPSVTAFGRAFGDVSLKANLRDGAWNANVKSREMEGDLQWQQRGKGRLRARLAKLALAEVSPRGTAPAAQERAVQELPALDVVAENFSLGGRNFGRLELQAVNQARLWRIDKLRLENPDGMLDATGQWRPGGADGGARGGTGLAFKLETANAGALLERLGYGNAVKRANAKLQGKVGWAGPPIDIDYPTLEGDMTLEAGRGQFARLDPGVGRLLGVLSLQALPRRITLDFRDVFSEGFAFDGISGSIAMQRGVLDTQDLRIQGPAAKVQMRGQVSLADETQNLRVRVQPTLSETVAIGAAVVNPVAGAVTYLAQKVFKDPFEKMFSYEYAVTGGWDDPKVEKLARAAPAQP